MFWFECMYFLDSTTYGLQHDFLHSLQNAESVQSPSASVLKVVQKLQNDKQPHVHVSLQSPEYNARWTAESHNGSPLLELCRLTNIESFCLGRSFLAGVAFLQSDGVSSGSVVVLALILLILIGLVVVAIILTVPHHHESLRTGDDRRLSYRSREMPRYMSRPRSVSGGSNTPEASQLIRQPLSSEVSKIPLSQRSETSKESLTPSSKATPHMLTPLCSALVLTSKESKFTLRLGPWLSAKGKFEVCGIVGMPVLACSVQETAAGRQIDIAIAEHTMTVARVSEVLQKTTTNNLHFFDVWDREGKLIGTMERLPTGQHMLTSKGRMLLDFSVETSSRKLIVRDNNDIVAFVARQQEPSGDEILEMSVGPRNDPILIIACILGTICLMPP